ncbi:MAG: 6-carboxytetrahydropterin synthase [Gammaproteobacteria bacterium]|jgi:6-pyruvoyl-tetrahydropterin synthase|nr:6-carboxytetrahydropterin synthase [Gammaproteobacteria bacterium]MDH3749228.1 6-carboxytetrahydropterin synthase [Gammaproteobacteria bacterium]MDH3803890.1 6-carboxytetrahydropterin synthase [Gammaproteobacteria bacterium]
MYSVTVRESVMIAHSLADPAFGPAQNLHGATYVVDVEFVANDLNDKNVVIDIGIARNIARASLEPIAYRNLDELAEFEGKLTTAEFVARYVHDAVAAMAKPHFDGRICVRLKETHDAWVSYEG